MAVFSDVKTVLDTIIANWTTGNGDAPNLLGKSTHNTDTFGWSTKAELLRSVARGFPLIQPALIGVRGSGQTANIVVALTSGVGGFPKMPFGGLDSNSGVFLTLGSPEIQTIVSWIEAGCPD